MSAPNKCDALLNACVYLVVLLDVKPKRVHRVTRDPDLLAYANDSRPVDHRHRTEDRVRGNRNENDGCRQHTSEQSAFTKSSHKPPSDLLPVMTQAPWGASCQAGKLLPGRIVRDALSRTCRENPFRVGDWLSPSNQTA